MLQSYLNQSMDEKNSVEINQMTWSVVRRHLKTFLDTTWIEGHQLIIFRHSSLEQVILIYFSLNDFHFLRNYDNVV